MKGILSGLFQRAVLGNFLAGILTLLPIILTVVIINWLVRQIGGLLGPGSLLGNLLTSAGTVVVGEQQSQLAFWLGLSIALAGIWSLGLVVTLQARRSLTGMIDALFNRVPLLATIYRPVAQVVRLLDKKGEGELTGMDVVSVRSGPAGMDMLALQASPQVFYIDGEARLLIYLPTAPIPMGGFLLLFPENDVTPVPEMEVDDLMKVYFSIGTLASDAMPGSIGKA